MLFAGERCDRLCDSFTAVIRFPQMVVCCDSEETLGLNGTVATSFGWLPDAAMSARTAESEPARKNAATNRNPHDIHRIMKKRLIAVSSKLRVTFHPKSENRKIC